MVTKKIIIHGLVQQVGFRSYTKKIAEELGILGSVKNKNDGSVEVYAKCSNLKIFNKFKKSLYIGPKHSHVISITISNLKSFDLFYSFNIL